MKNNNINKIRIQLDKIDIRLLKIIKKRSLLVDKILKLKKNKKEIIDKKRINFIFKKIKKFSLKEKIDPRITTSIWKSMIKGFIDYEYRGFKKK